jgi:outer membrane lipoprotein SlyB
MADFDPPPPPPGTFGDAKSMRKAQVQQAKSDVRRHAGALGGMAIGGLLGSVVPGIGTVIGMAAGAVIGHFSADGRD